MSLYMETTKISAERTAAEIERLLQDAGATAVLKEYDPGTRKLCKLSFKLRIPDKGEVSFQLPARVTPVFIYIQKQHSVRVRQARAQRDCEQAERVAWRQLLRWIQAQLALIDVGMVDAAEVFLAYAVDRTGRTLYERILDGSRLLTEGEAPPESNVVSFDARKV